MFVFIGCDQTPGTPGDKPAPTADTQRPAQKLPPQPEATSEIPPSTSEIKSEVQRLLEEGDAACENWNSLASRRAYDELQSAYELLRLSYPRLVDRFAGLPAADQASTLAALERWEEVIARWRQPKTAIFTPPETNDVDSERFKLSDEMRDRLQELYKDSENKRKLKEAADAPLEQALDAAIAKVQKLRKAEE